MRVLKKFFKVFKTAAGKFVEDNAVKLGASLSYYTIFALPPMLIIIISVSGFFFGRDAIQGQVYAQISTIVGSQSALFIQDTLKNIAVDNNASFIATVLSVITLIIGSTGIFAEIQDSINYIWSIKAKPRRGWLKLILNRVLSFSMIVIIGFLLMVSLILNLLMDVISARLITYFPNLAIRFFYILNQVVVIAVITTMFTTIFKILPDARVRLRDAIRGAAFTAILFMIGKFLISYYMANYSGASIYGAAGSVIVLLLWVYYSSIILFFGAEFTVVYANMFGRKIIPNQYSVFIEKREIEHERFEADIEEKVFHTHRDESRP